MAAQNGPEPVKNLAGIQGMTVEPYYDRDGITIYCGDCREILPTLPAVDLVLSDPPYGIFHPCDFKKRGRGKLTECRDYPDVHGDDEPFDPQPWLRTGPCILWGGNHFASRLPDTSGWLVWDKERPDDLDQATCELAWTNIVKGVRRFRYLWNGCMRQGDDQLYHPTQKPVALMRWCLGLKWTKDCSLILDPYMGSGTTLVAAKLEGKRAIGIEINPEYCEVAKARLRQKTMF